MLALLRDMKFYLGISSLHSDCLDHKGYCLTHLASLVNVLFSNNLVIFRILNQHAFNFAWLSTWPDKVGQMYLRLIISLLRKHRRNSSLFNSNNWNHNSNQKAKVETSGLLSCRHFPYRSSLSYFYEWVVLTTCALPLQEVACHSAELWRSQASWTREAHGSCGKLKDFCSYMSRWKMSGSD